MHTAQSIFLMRTLFSPEAKGENDRAIFFSHSGEGEGLEHSVSSLALLTVACMRRRRRGKKKRGSRVSTTGLGFLLMTREEGEGGRRKFSSEVQL